MGLLEVGLLKFYQWVVDTAPPESWSVRTFTYLATGPFRCALTWRSPCGAHLYDVGVFGRQLITLARPMTRCCS
jgi:hypothetical protein